MAGMGDLVGAVQNGIKVIGNLPSQFTTIFNNTYALLNGSSTQPFSAANATPATQEAIPIIQADARYAPLNGDAGELFSAANGTAGNEVVNYSQVANQSPPNLAGGTTGTTFSASTAAWTAPSNGVLSIYAISTANGTLLTSLTLTSTLSGLSADATGTNQNYIVIGSLPMAAGDTTTLTATVIASTSVAIAVAAFCIFTPTP